MLADEKGARPATMPAMRRTPRRILVLEPWLGGSHARFLEQWSARSRHAVQVRGLPARHWKWRMRSSAWQLARDLAGDPPDALLVSDYVDLPALFGFLPASWARVPAAVYFHENQLTYPTGSPTPDDAHYGFTNVLSCVRAERAVFNSAFARDSFATAARELLGRLPAPRPGAEFEQALERSVVISPGIELEEFPLGPGGPRRAVLRVAFNHRWEHDKDPAAFLCAALAACERLEGAADLELLLLGQRFENLPAGVPELLDRLRDRIVADGFAADRARYARTLGTADVVVSTARHEFCGLAVLEAAACGATPLLPERLSYPELIPAEFRPRVLYRGDAQLVERLTELARGPAAARDPSERERWRSSVAAPHDAGNTARALDGLFDELCGTEEPGEP